MITQPINQLIPMRPCGKSDLRLSALGMGCWAFGGGDYWGPQSQEDVNAVVRHALDHGCNFLDTAEAYNNGASESSLGIALRGVPRASAIIGTKISPSNTSPRTLVEHCEASLRRLGTDYIDLYMVHWPITPGSIQHFSQDPGPAPSAPAAFQTLMELQKAGKIRYIGVSNFGRERLAEALATGAEIVINELPYSLLARAVELEILPYCSKRGIGVLGYMSLMQGVLADTFPRLEDVPLWRRRTRHFDCRGTAQCRHGLPGAEAETSAALRAIREVAQRLDLSMADLALRWAMAGPGITSSLCGSRNVKQLEQNLRAGGEPLPAGIREELNCITEPLLQKLGPSFDYYEHPDKDRTR